MQPSYAGARIVTVGLSYAGARIVTVGLGLMQPSYAGARIVTVGLMQPSYAFSRGAAAYFKGGGGGKVCLTFLPQTIKML